MIEFALLIPVLLILVLGIIQYGRLASTTAVLANLSREGARYAALSRSTTDAEIKQRVLDSAQATRVVLTEADITIDPDEVTRTDTGNASMIGKPVKVTITYDMSKQLFLPGTAFLVKAFKSGGKDGYYAIATTMRIQG